jgi:type IV secretion system protein TrbL
MAFSKYRQELLTAPLAVVVFLAFLAGASPSFAASSSTADGVAAVNAYIDAFKLKGEELFTTIDGAATSLFWILAVIQFCWAGSRLALNGNYTLAGIVGTVVREIFFIGFFYWLLTQGPTLGTNIVGGLRTLGGKDLISPGDLFSKGVGVIYALTKTAFELGVYGTVWAAVPYALALGALAFSAAYAAVYLLEYYIAVPLGVILLGLGGSLWSKKFTENYVRVLISIGFKLAALQIAIAIAIDMLADLQTSINDYATVGREGFFLHSFNLAGLAALVFVTISKLPEFAAGLVAGTWFQSATGLEFTIPGSSSLSPVYAGLSDKGGGARSVDRERGDALRTLQYAGDESYTSQYWQGQESNEGYVFRVSEEFSSGGDFGFSGVPSPSSPLYSQYSQTVEAGRGRDDALTESNFLGTPFAGGGKKFSGGSAEAGSPAGSELIKPFETRSVAAGAEVRGTLEAERISEFAASGFPDVCAPRGSGAPTEAKLPEPSMTEGPAAGAKAEGTPEAERISEVERISEAFAAGPAESESVKFSSERGPGDKIVNVSVDGTAVPGRTTVLPSIFAEGPDFFGTEGQEVDVSVSVSGAPGSGASGMERLRSEALRSVVVGLFAREGGGEEYGGGGDSAAEYIQKQFPMTEMSSLQIEIFKGMTE